MKIALLIWCLLGNLLLTASAMESKPETLKELALRIEQKDCWCILVVPKISKGGTPYEPQQQGSKLNGKGVAQLFDGFKETEVFLKLLSEGLHRRVEQAEKPGLHEGVDQYTIYFLMRQAPTGEGESISAFLFKDGSIQIRGKDNVYWWLDDKLSKWLGEMILPLNH